MRSYINVDMEVIYFSYIILVVSLNVRSYINVDIEVSTFIIKANWDMVAHF